MKVVEVVVTDPMVLEPFNDSKFIHCLNCPYVLAYGAFPATALFLSFGSLATRNP